jgi:hypothetical protein
VANRRPTATAAAAPTEIASGTPLPPAALSSGTFSAAYVWPHLSFTVPDGFDVRAEKTDYLWLSIGISTTAPEFAIIRVAQPGVIAGLTNRADLLVSAPVPTAVADAAAQAVDLSTPVTASGNVRIVNTATSTYFVFPPDTAGRLIEFAVRGAPMVILYDAPAGGLAAFRPVAEQIVASLRFPG